MTQSVNEKRRWGLHPLPMGWAILLVVWGILTVLLEGRDLLDATAWSLLWWWTAFKLVLGVLGFALGAYSAVVALRATDEVAQ